MKVPIYLSSFALSKNLKGFVTLTEDRPNLDDPRHKSLSGRDKRALSLLKKTACKTDY